MVYCGIWYFSRTDNEDMKMGNYHSKQERSPCVNPLLAKLSYLNFHPLEVVSRYRDPQLQVGENYACNIRIC